MLERYGFHFDVIYAQNIDTGEFKSRYDVVILTDDAVLDARDGSQSAIDVPPEYRRTTGSLTTDRSLPQLKQFVEAGGTVITVGHSTTIASALGLPISSALVESRSDGVRPLTRRAVLRPRLGAARERRQHHTARVRVRTPGRYLLR